MQENASVVRTLFDLFLLLFSPCSMEQMKWFLIHQKEYSFLRHYSLVLDVPEIIGYDSTLSSAILIPVYLQYLPTCHGFLLQYTMVQDNQESVRKYRATHSCSLAPLSHLLALHCLIHSICFASALAHSLSPELVIICPNIRLF